MSVNLKLLPEDIEWHRRLWESLNDGGVWTIPRSGAVLRRQGDSMVHVDGFSDEALYDVIMAFHHFEAIGVPVIRAENIPMGEHFNPVTERRRGT